MTDEEKYKALQCIIICGENPRLFEFSPLDFLEEMYLVYKRNKRDNNYDHDWDWTNYQMMV